MDPIAVKILKIEQVTHDVKRFIYSKPEGYLFTPGQATDVAINKPGFVDQLRPFTFTGLPEWDELQFTIKIYPHIGVTNELGKLVPRDELFIHDPWGAINYKGPGIFLAGGAGVTPFISIFRHLFETKEVDSNKLFFANKTSGDIILKDEFTKILGSNFHNTLSREKNTKYEYGRIDEEFLKKHIQDFNTNFYVCGPDSFVKDINAYLAQLGVKPESLVFEK